MGYEVGEKGGREGRIKRKEKQNSSSLLTCNQIVGVPERIPRAERKCGGKIMKSSSLEVEKDAQREAKTPEPWPKEGRQERSDVLTHHLSFYLLSEPVFVYTKILNGNKRDFDI